MSLDDDLLAITQNVMGVMFELPVEPTEENVAPAPDAICGTIAIDGSWQGRVFVEASPSLAQHLASTMLAIDATEVQPVDLADAIAELTNMIGGGVKGCLPGPSSLALPQVATGGEATAPGPNELAGTAALVGHQIMTCAGGALRASIVFEPTATTSDGSPDESVPG